MSSSHALGSSCTPEGKALNDLREEREGGTNLAVVAAAAAPQPPPSAPQQQLESCFIHVQRSSLPREEAIKGSPQSCHFFPKCRLSRSHMHARTFLARFKTFSHSLYPGYVHVQGSAIV